MELKTLNETVSDTELLNLIAEAKKNGHTSIEFKGLKITLKQNMPAHECGILD